MKQKEIYLGALLHDIGKFVERSRYYDSREVYKNYPKNGEIAHSSFSAYFLYELKSKNNFFKTFISDNIINLVYNHHNPKNIYEKIIQLADNLSASEREDDESNNTNYQVERLKSIFSEIKCIEKESTVKENYYPLKPLTTENIIPYEKEKAQEFKYSDFFNQFYKEVIQIENETQLYYVLEKYLWTIPAQTVKHIPDISLFDHSKTTAAIAICLFDDFNIGILSETEINKLIQKKESIDKDIAFLIKGDISGIQKFIFNVSSKQAAKSLKGRSAYINFLSLVTAKYFLDKFDLEECNLLYIGGGNFYIIVPSSKKDKFDEIRKDYLKILLNKHKGEIYYAIDYNGIKSKDFSEFKDVWNKAKNKSHELKNKKWSEIGLKENYKNIFGPLTEIEDEYNICEICKSNQEVVTSKENLRICKNCKSYIEFGENIRNSKYLSIKKDNKNRLFGDWGYCIEFLKEKDDNSLLINSTDFIKSKCNGYLYFPTHLPLNNDTSIKTFDEISNLSEGAKKLGVLKLDVDNLGSIFSKGLENPTISRITSLSKILKLYFEGVISDILKEFSESIYVIYSGGDDTFILGAYNDVLLFVQKFREKFRVYTSFNTCLTFSAGFTIIDSHQNVKKFAEATEDALGKGKKYKNLKNEITKDKIVIFDEVFTWDEFDIIYDLANNYKELIKDKCENKAFLQKIMISCKDFDKILEEKRKNKFQPIKLWRLSYYLRNMNKNNQTEKEEIIKIFNEIALSEHKVIENPITLPTAIRLAELLTRKQNNGGKND